MSTTFRDVYAHNLYDDRILLPCRIVVSNSNIAHALEPMRVVETLVRDIAGYEPASVPEKVRLQMSSSVTSVITIDTTTRLTRPVTLWRRALANPWPCHSGAVTTRPTYIMLFALSPILSAIAARSFVSISFFLCSGHGEMESIVSYHVLETCAALTFLASGFRCNFPRLLNMMSTNQSSNLAFGPLRPPAGNSLLDVQWS